MDLDVGDTDPTVDECLDENGRCLGVYGDALPADYDYDEKVKNASVAYSPWTNLPEIHPGATQHRPKSLGSLSL